jgi:hypothetical protein
VYEKGGEQGNGLERYTRQGAKPSVQSYVGIEVRPGLGAVHSPVLWAMSEVHSPRVSELVSPMVGREVAELHSPAVASSVAELPSPIFEARVAELGGNIEKSGVAEVGGRKVGRGVELNAAQDQQSSSRFYGGAR